MPRKTVIVHSDSYANWFFSDDHPTQGRRFINGFKAMPTDFLLAEPRPATREDLARVHTPEYIREVLEEYSSTEWVGPREDLAGFAQLFAGGTLVALQELLDGKAELAIHLPGAKHHAQANHSSGFCVFNDFAMAADIATKEHGLRVAILDIDAHHGDGVENLTAENPNVLTFSIHQRGIFPGTGNVSDVSRKVYNFPLTRDTGRGDDALMGGIETFIPLAKEFNPDLLFITCGADGLMDDPLTNLEYSVEGYGAAAKLVGSAFSEIPILMGGAGGYLPDGGTPEVWAAVSHSMASA